MIPIHRDQDHRFTFAEPRLVGRFHLADVPAGVPVRVSALGPDGVPGAVLFEALTGEGGWVVADPPLRVGPSNGFVARVKYPTDPLDGEK